MWDIKDKLKDIDIDPFSDSQTTLGEGYLEELRIRLESEKRQYNAIYKELKEKREDLKFIEKQLPRYKERPNYELLLEDIQGINEEIKEIESKIKFHPYKETKREYDYLRSFVIPDNPISNSIIDKVSLKYSLVPLDKKDFIIYQNKELTRDEAKRRIYLEYWTKRFKTLLRAIFYYCKENKEALELKDVFAHEYKKLYTYRLDFTDGLTFELFPEFPFSPKITFNVITYDPFNKIDYNFILRQNKYQALTRCIDRASATLFRFYNNIEHFVSTPQNRKLFIDNSMGYTLERLLRPDINKLYLKRLEIHQNYRLRNPELIYPFTNCLYMLFSKALIPTNMIEKTVYLNSKSKSYPKTRIYPKTDELREKYGINIDGTFLRCENDFTEEVIKRQCGGLDVSNIKYIHPENRDIPENILSLKHREVLFNNYIDNLFQKNNPLSFFGKYISLLCSSLYLKDEELLNEKLGKTTYFYLDLLNFIYQFGTIGSIEEETGLPDRTLSRHVSRLVKEGIVYKDYARKRYLLTPKGLILHDRKNELLELFEISFANFSNPCSSTSIEYSPLTITNLLRDIIDLSLFTEGEDDGS